MLAADLNYDFRLDVVVADANGVKFLRQEAAGRFTDVTAATKLPAALLKTPMHGAWAADMDTDGDLDIVAAPVDAARRPPCCATTATGHSR